MTDRAELQRQMIAAADGDRRAIEPLFRALWPIVVAYSTRLLGDATLGEDTAQDALAHLFGQLARFDRERDALTWALTIATWECRTARRRRARSRQRDAGAASDAREPSYDGADAAQHRDLVRAALDAVAMLAPRDREFLSAALDDDTALRAALAPATFRKRLERALARLRTTWRSRHGTL